MRVYPIAGRRFLVFCLFGCSVIAAPAAGQEVAEPPLVDLRNAFSAPPAVTPQALPPALKADAREPKRPAGLLPLYVSFAGLQALDIHSSKRGMGSGATRENNPVMRPFVDNDAAFIAVKASATAGTIFFTEKLRKKHPKMAVALVAGFNVGMAFVVAHNYRLVR